MPDPLSDRALITAQNLRIDAVSMEITRALDQAGIAHVLLKGPSTVKWLYSSPRKYSDTDLLVDPHKLDACSQVLTRLDFAEKLRVPVTGDPPISEWHWHRVSDDSWVDIHTNILGIGLPSNEAWRVLSSRVEPMTLLDRPVPVFDVPARLFVLVLHAAYDARLGHPVRDLELALGTTTERDRNEAHRLAGELDALAAFRTGLSTVAEGRRLIDTLGLNDERSVEAHLRLLDAPSEVRTIERFMAQPLRGKGRMIVGKIFPSPRFMRTWSGLAAHGRVGLALSYVIRPLWMVARSFRALWQWGVARRRLK